MKKEYFILLFLVLIILFSLIHGCKKNDETTNWKQEHNVLIRNFTWNVDSSFHIYFDVINNTDSAVYVMVSDWYLDGMKQRYIPKNNWPQESTINKILYIPSYPKFIPLNIKSLIYRTPSYKGFPTFVKLAPRQSQRIHLSFKQSFYKMIKRTINQIKFNITLYYLTQTLWEKNREAFIFYYDSNNSVIEPSTKPWTCYIPFERESVHYGIVTPLDSHSPHPIYLIPVTGELKKGF
ncbi:MAG TPA: hypothetical protein PLE74_06095 [Candidatus Cloacimonadota bacterium]|nr:hypothetical protein [Candidatus Cloacimonadota bacterium]